MKDRLHLVDGAEHFVVTRVFFGWDVADRRGHTFVSTEDFPSTYQTAGLGDFVDGRSVAGAIVDRAKAA